MGLGRHFGRPAVYQERLAVPLLPAPLGEVINVGTEGMMLGGAVGAGAECPPPRT